jgi:hypothetical protein
MIKFSSSSSSSSHPHRRDCLLLVRRLHLRLADPDVCLVVDPFFARLFGHNSLVLHWGLFLAPACTPVTIRSCSLRPQDSAPFELSWSRTYGGIFSLRWAFGETRLYLSDPVALQHVLVTHCYSYPKPNQLRDLMSGALGKVRLHIHWLARMYTGYTDSSTYVLINAAGTTFRRR